VSEEGIISIAENFRLHVQKHLIDRGISILGMRGSGKSYTVGVICEELLSIGQPIIVIDLMGEYYTLRERYPILIAALGSPEYADIKGVTPEVAPQLAEFVVSNGLSIVLDLKYGMMVDRFRFLGAFLESLYHTEERYKHPYVLIMDEGHRITPEKGVIRIKSIRDAQSRVEAWVYEVGATGRHYGLGFIVVARRSAEISKMTLAQTEIRIFHKLVDPTDLNYISNWLTKEQIERVRSFRKGEAVVVGLEEPVFIKVKKRLCSHGGGTPLTKPVETPDLAEAVGRLGDLLSRPEEVEEVASVEMERLEELEEAKRGLEERVRRLESQLAEANAQLRSLEAMNEEYRRRIKELEARIPEADRISELMKSYEEKLLSLEEELKKKDLEIHELNTQLEEASKDYERLEEIRDLLLDWRDITIDLARHFDVEIIPSDMQKIIDERDRYKDLYESLKEEIERRNRLAESVLNDPAVRDWVKLAKRTLHGFMSRRSAHGEVLRKIVVTDPNYLFLPEEFPEAGVASTTVATYLNDFERQGLVIKHERAKMGRTAWSNGLPLWVSQNVRRIRLDAPDEAVNQIIEELKSYVLRG